PNLLRRAAAAHQAGRLAEVEQLCRAVLAAVPDQPDAQFLLAGVAAATGRPAAAIDLLRRAIDRNPRRAEFHGNLGAVLGRAGRLDEAIACFRQAIALAPGAAAGYLALGNALQAKGDMDGAIAAIRQAVAAQPDNAPAHVNLGNALKRAARLDEAAASFRAAVRLNPNLPEAQHNLGVVLFIQGRLAEAEPALRAALRLRPDNPLTFRQLALALIAAGRLDEAAQFLIEPVRRQRRPGAAGDAPAFRQTNRVKLQHDADQLSYLAARGLGSDGYSELVAEHGRLAAQRADEAAFDIPTTSARLATHYNRLIHWRETPARTEGVLSPDWDGAAVERDYRAHPPGYAWFDGLLTRAALQELRQFCLDSTVWFQMTFKNEISATLFNGFCCPLLLQIAQELRHRLPGLLGRQPLSLAWAYKYCGPFSGLGPHADDGAVAVNFWITPDEANEDPAGGGLVIWDRLVPKHYLLRDRPAQETIIRSLIEEPGTTAVAVPYRCNRAAIFDGMIAHSTDAFRFKDGYENRRINITLLYGHAD
ncbi:MAG: tetratricopeptide repeat protein, partial [Dongiaceae bacterium]